jgi:hypothetical protein
MTTYAITDLYNKPVQSNGEGNIVGDSRALDLTGPEVETIGNKFRLGLLPAGVELFELKLVNGAVDDGANLAVNLGYEAVDGDAAVTDADYFAAASAVLQAQATTRFDFAGLKLQKDVYLIATVTTGAGGSNVATAHTGTGEDIRLQWLGKTHGVK